MEWNVVVMRVTIFYSLMYSTCIKSRAKLLVLDTAIKQAPVFRTAKGNPSFVQV
jgi:hypothetical protein